VNYLRQFASTEIPQLLCWIHGVALNSDSPARAGLSEFTNRKSGFHFE